MGIAYRDMTITQKKKVIDASKKWKLKNLERVKEYEKNRKRDPEYNAKRRERYRSDPLFRKQASAKKKINYQKIKELSKNNPRLALSRLLTKIKSRAKIKKQDFDLTIDYIMTLWERQKGKCKLSGLPMTSGIGSGKMKVSIDRINSNKGYTKRNSQLVRTDVNIAKNDLAQKEFIKICKSVAKNN